MIACIRDRFSQPGYAVLQRLESLLFHAAKAQPYTDDVDFVLKQYGADFEASALKTQLEIFGTFMAGHPDAALDPFANYSKPCHPLNKQTYHKFAYC